MNTYDQRYIGEQLKNFRHLNAYTIEQLSEISQISSSTIKRIERGQVVPTLDTISILSYYLKLDLIDLINGNANQLQATFDQSLIAFYQLMEMRHYDGLDQLIEETKICYSLEKFDEHSLKSKSHFQKVDQLILWMESTKYSRHQNNYKTAVSLLFDAMNISFPDFRLDNFKDYFYSTFEVNILNAIGVNYTFMDELEIGRLIFNYIILLEQNRVSPNYRNMIKAYYNLTSMNMYLESYEAVICIANEALDICKRNSLNIDYPNLYYKKALAYWLLGNEDGVNDLKIAIHLYRTYGQEKQAEKMTKVLIEKYGIIVD